jgi:hypothetical protein
MEHLLMDELSAGLPARATPEHWINLALKLACPVCRAPGLVRVRELDRALMCKACNSWFCVQPTRLVQIPRPPQVIQVEVRTESSAYKTHDVVLDNVLRQNVLLVLLWRLVRLRPWHLPWHAVGIISMVAASLCAVALNYPFGSLEAPDTPLPTDLDARERVLVEAWLREDIHQMLRLVSTTRDRDLRQWLLKHPAPESTNGPMSKRTTAIDIASVTKSIPNIADVIARVNLLADATSGAELIIKHRWANDKDGTWYFVPYVPPSPPRFRYK